VEEAAPFNRPFFQKLYRIHDTADLLDNMAVVSYENRLFERRTLHSDLPSNRGATDPASPCAAMISSRQKHAGELGERHGKPGRDPGIFKEDRYHAFLPAPVRLDIRQVALGT
jgi:hypothetical protein